MLDKIKHLYVTATRTALLARHNKTHQLFHVFSVIELQTIEMPLSRLPDPSWYGEKVCRSSLSSGSNDYSFSLVVHTLNIDDAVDAFHNIQSGKLIDSQPIYHFDDHFIAEPSGNHPLIVDCADKRDDGLAAVLPKRVSGALVWTKLDAKRTVEKLFRANKLTANMKEMSQLTSDWLGFDIWTMPEHIGNIYLSAVNPYYRQLNLTLDRDRPAIIYHFYYRNGFSDMLTMRVIDYHGEHLAFDESFEIKSAHGVIPIPHEPYKVEVRIYNRDGSLIATKGPFVFLRSIQINMQVKEVDIHLTVNDEKGSRNILVPKYSKPLPIVTGTSANFDPASYFKLAAESRNSLKLEQRKEFIFFASSESEKEKSEVKERARKTIKEIIDQAEGTCYLCDPYFSANELVDFVFTAKNSGLTVNIVNRRGKDFIGLDMARVLKETIEQWDERFQKIECRMLKSDLLHDRFIITDTKVWFLGSSFNEIGNRATCIARVPASADVTIVRKIEEWFFGDATQSLDDYIKEQRKNG